MAKAAHRFRRAAFPADSEIELSARSAYFLAFLFFRFFGAAFAFFFALFAIVRLFQSSVRRMCCALWEA
jgi:hypothetical protein